MVAMRNTLQILVALVAALAVTVSAQYYDLEEDLDARDFSDYLDARELGLLEYQAPVSRGFVDGDDYVLTARDLARLGIRSDEISHVVLFRRVVTGSGGVDGGQTNWLVKYKQEKKGMTKKIKKLKKTIARLVEKIKDAKPKDKEALQKKLDDDQKAMEEDQKKLEDDNQHINEIEQAPGGMPKAHF